MENVQTDGLLTIFNNFKVKLVKITLFHFNFLFFLKKAWFSLIFTWVREIQIDFSRGSGAIIHFTF